MKVLALALTFATLSSIQACTLDGLTVSGCYYSAIVNESGCSTTQLETLLGSNYRERIESACNEAFAVANEEMLPWDAVTKRGYQFDKEYFNGGTIFNTETDSIDFVKDTRRLTQIRNELLSKHGIAWPSNIVNFDNEQCESQAAMCCWVSSRDPNMQGEPEDNTDVCSHEMSNSPRSAHVEGGDTVFIGEQGPVNCHGFYWNGGERYRGNLLFHVAMSHGLLDNQYVRNIPGAPMCGCVEQMPVVTHSDCTAMEVSETFVATFDTEDFSIKMVGDPAISFTPCSGDGTLTGGHATEGLPGDIEKYVTGKASCDEEEYDALTSVSFKERAADEEWVPVAGKGYLYNPSLSMEEFNEMFAKTPNHIIRRRCFECDHTHKDVYYRRYDANNVLPEGFDLLYVLKNYWHDIDGNKFHHDFEIYSTYDDALNNRNPWLYCNFGWKTIGFPRDCGPVTWVGNQWNAFDPVDGHHHGKYHVGFYIEGENNKAGVPRESE